MLAELDEAARVEEERAQALMSMYRKVVGRMSKQQVDRAAREHTAHCGLTVGCADAGLRASATS